MIEFLAGPCNIWVAGVSWTTLSVQWCPCCHGRVLKWRPLQPWYPLDQIRISVVISRFYRATNPVTICQWLTTWNLRQLPGTTSVHILICRRGHHYLSPSHCDTKVIGGRSDMFKGHPLVRQHQRVDIVFTYVSCCTGRSFSHYYNDYCSLLSHKVRGK